MPEPDRRTCTTAQQPSAVKRLFTHLPRTDQRRWAGVYVRGLLTTPGKKSVRRLACHTHQSRTASQSLHQLVNVSPWRWQPMRDELARWVTEDTVVRAWTLAPIVITKRGVHSVGVHRRFVLSGYTVACQFAVGLFLDTDLGTIPVDWELYLPPDWLGDPTARRRARIPDGVQDASETALCLRLLDRRLRLGNTPRVPVVADARSHFAADTLIEGLDRRGLDWTLGIPQNWRGADWAHRRPRSPSSDHRWLTNLPPGRALETRAHILALAGAPPPTAAIELGLQDFGGRSYPGWHRHATLVSVACAMRLLDHRRAEEQRIHQATRKAACA